MSYSYIDLSYLRDFSQGNQNFIREILSVALEQTGAELSVIKKALQAGDAVLVGRVCHKLRSSLGFLGVRPVVIEQLKESEKQVLSGTGELKTIVDAVLLLCRQVNAEVEAALKELKD